MGMDQTVYFGPFLHCINTPIKIEEQVPGCKKCDKQMSSQFCSTCGTKQSILRRSRTQPKVDWWEICEAHDEALYRTPERSDGDNEYFLPNRHGVGRTFSKYTDQFDPITDIDKQSDIEQFEEQFADIIQAMKQAYGEDNVSIKWGFINYWN